MTIPALTIPALTPCPKPNCKAPIIHWHDLDGHVSVCRFALDGDPCLHVEAGNFRCYAPRETSPLHLPDVDTTARAIYESDNYYPTTSWATQSEDVKDEYRRNARDVLDLIANRQPVWKRVEPGTRIEEGQRYRIEYANGDAYELTAFGTRSVQDDGTTVYVLSTPPTPETRDSIVREFAAELDRIYTERTAGDSTWIGMLSTFVSRLDALGGEDK